MNIISLIIALIKLAPQIFAIIKEILALFNSKAAAAELKTAHKAPVPVANDHEERRRAILSVFRRIRPNR